ncbi:zinc ribbon domain-containing protein [Rhodopirellula sp. P2]|uniref:zinc ribbon domain-containing protein n=1 Tax=Rhodopirellula sp. P2 TaxID=2127060 RepID=UPI00236780F1|nr:zinc ribbon domain-containing protein [Rhodopirellula sp. P2]WDQ16014.1 zinc ribbon domain-containing protein [Rhodopirellula sp. P2]
MIARLISLRCDHCGAPIDVKPKAKYVTCGYCHANLAIHHTGSSYSTELIEDLKETTNALVKDVALIKHNAALDRLDEQWERWRLQTLGTNKHGRQITQPPNPVVSIFGFGFVFVFALVWTGMAAMMFAPMALFGLIFLVMAVVGLFSSFSKTNEYHAKRRRYMQERQSLVEQIQNGD